MSIVSLCPHCAAEHELTEQLVGQTIHCQKCRTPFAVVAQPERTSDKAFEVQTLFAENHQDSNGKSSVKSQQSRGPLSLVLPPPPQETWSGKKTQEREESFR